MCEESKIDKDSASEGEVVNIAELKVRPPYTCKLLKKGEVNYKMAKKIYSFGVSKVEQIFDVLLKDKQIKLSDDHKLPSMEQRKRKKYCKFHYLWSYD